MRQIVAPGYVKAGKLGIQNKPGFDALLARMKDGEVVVRVEKPKTGPSLLQYAWYWGQVLELISDHTGYEPEELHEYFKQRFLPKHLAIADHNGEVKDDIVIGGSTTKLEPPEFADYCERIRRFAAEELYVVIPDPDPKWRDAA